MEYNLSKEIASLTHNYLTNVYPFESLAKAIALQEK